MSRKRKNTSSPEASPSPSPDIEQPTRAPVYDSDDAVDPDERPHLDNEFGQTGAFPGLGYNDGNEPFYGPAGDGVDYLRMVRAEARGVPSLLTAARQTETTPPGDTAIDVRYSEDDAYIAPPSIPAIIGSQHPTTQTRYYESLLAQFHLLQATLRCTPSLTAIQALDAAHPISFPPNSTKALEQWQHQIKEKDPNMVQMACVDEVSVWKLLGLLNETLETTKCTSQKMGAWLWAALARCPDLWQMDSEDVSSLRDLARTAVDLLGNPATKDTNAPLGAQSLDPGMMSVDDHNEGDVSPINLKNMILDMVITVVGEVYGQRDLLEKRIVWQTPTTLQSSNEVTSTKQFS